MITDRRSLQPTGQTSPLHNVSYHVTTSPSFQFPHGRYHARGVYQPHACAYWKHISYPPYLMLCLLNVVSKSLVGLIPRSSRVPLATDASFGFRRERSAG
jgi:hypothetical protein